MTTDLVPPTVPCPNARCDGNMEANFDVIRGAVCITGWWCPKCRIRCGPEGPPPSLIDQHTTEEDA